METQQDNPKREYDPNARAVDDWDEDIWVAMDALLEAVAAHMVALPEFFDASFPGLEMRGPDGALTKSAIINYAQTWLAAVIDRD
jgi:hypothetical protein